MLSLGQVFANFVTYISGDDAIVSIRGLEL